jgi:hypothetical protein
MIIIEDARQEYVGISFQFACYDELDEFLMEVIGDWCAEGRIIKNKETGKVEFFFVTVP